MCGIWGIITHGKSCDRKSMEKIIEKLFLLSEVRGKDAAGIAVMSQRELNVFKRPQTAEIMLKDKKYHAFIEKNLSGGRIREGIAVIGHSRMVTNGTSGRADNNQPISRENMITVHNGIIVNADKLWKAHPELKRMYEVDTEIFVELCERYRLEMDTQEAVCKIYKDISGMASTLNLFADTGRVIAATNNGSLYYCISRDQFFIVFASERMILEKLIKKEATLNQHFAIESIKQMYPMEAIEVDPFKGKMRKFSLKEENGEKLEEKKEETRLAEEKAEEAQKDADEAKQTASDQQAVADKKQSEAQEERKSISQDQQAVAEKETANENAATVYGLNLANTSSLNSSIVKVNASNGSVVQESELDVIRGRAMHETSDGFIAIAGENKGNSAVKLVIIDQNSLEITKESEEVLSDNSVLVQDGSEYLVVIKDKIMHNVAKYDANLNLIKKSPVPVSPNSPIVKTSAGYMVTDIAGQPLLLDLNELTITIKQAVDAVSGTVQNIGDNAR